LNTDILLVDEVLAVGDSNFQKKCLRKINDISVAGHTVVFVSHNMESVASLTDKCLVLEAGKQLFFGPTLDAIQEYAKSNTTQDFVYIAEKSNSAPRITRVAVITSEPNNIHIHGQPLDVEIEITTPAALEDGAVAFQVFNLLQQAIMHLWIMDSQQPFGRQPGIFRLRCHIPKSRLYMGKYTLTVHFSERYGLRNPQKIEGICPFEVAMYGLPREFGWQPHSCTYIEDAEWNNQKIDHS
jgi:lipopolysaccharide transport system ATP-binding protein